ncbi:uncharacterized protein Pyn_03323 [Prunus yedoensis var. nudiflora]|uniref:Uncharacterized protein n=1 Tax=Prunus yedoensis var. nudiflora TaxID=2094558 RepID=A0A315AG57_PRUYE|nr:uncharacterized protein Pyn_03323 [Prunus yedoensis var. nudiflora]
MVEREEKGQRHWFSHWNEQEDRGAGEGLGVSQISVFPARGCVVSNNGGVNSSGAAAWEDDEDWELVNEDGFVFKRRKKRRVDPSADSSLRAPPSASAADLQEDAEKLRRERKKKSLLKLKTQYQAEIDQWELLSSTLRAVEERTCHLQEQQQQDRLKRQEREKTASLAGSGPSELQGSESVCGSVVDELLLQILGLRVLQGQKFMLHDTNSGLS